MKKPNDITCFFTFFTILDIIWPKFCPKTTPNLTFLLVSNEVPMLGNSINIKNFHWNPVVLKKIAKISKNYYFLAQLVQKWGPHRPRQKQKKIFFLEITDDR